MQTIEIGNQRFEGPGSWKEMTADHLVHLAKCIHLGEAPDKPENILINSALVFALFKIPVTTGSVLKRFQCDQLAEVLDFLYKTNDNSRWLFPTIKVNWLTRWQGPADRLANLTAWEFVQAEAYYERYSFYKEEKYLDGLIGILFRRKNMLTRQRAGFRERSTQKRFSAAAKLPIELKLAVYTNYTGSRNMIIRLHPNIFYRGNTESATNKFIEWNNHLIKASGGPLGDYEATKKQNVWIVLKHMDDLAGAAKRTTR